MVCRNEVSYGSRFRKSWGNGRGAVYIYQSMGMLSEFGRICLGCHD
ncbi:MAG: hypothetical protein LBQ88_06790 [Treponema sp.]|nr:hypothetical protein [Treponema sp.]